MYGICSAYLSLMKTRKSFGVEENSSKLAMSSCFTWMGSQSSMMNLGENRKNGLKITGLKVDMKINILSMKLWIKSWRCKHTTYHILLLQGFSMYMSMFSHKMAEVLWMKQIHKSICSCICNYVSIHQRKQIPQ